MRQCDPTCDRQLPFVDDSVAAAHLARLTPPDPTLWNRKACSPGLIDSWLGRSSLRSARVVPPLGAPVRQDGMALPVGPVQALSCGSCEEFQGAAESGAVDDDEVVVDVDASLCGGVGGGADVEELLGRHL